MARPVAKPRAHKGNLADYARPPLIEVVFGVKFAPLKDWMIPHVGAFWHQVMGAFPRCEHAPPIGDTDFVDAATGIPLPRVWLIASEDDRLIQLQPGRFLFNWRHRKDSGSYPRYKMLSRTFFGLFRDFRSFVARQELGDTEVLEYELTYINHVLEQNGWKFPEQLGRVINRIEWQDRPTAFSRILP